MTLVCGLMRLGVEEGGGVEEWVPGRGVGEEEGPGAGVTELPLGQGGEGECGGGRDGEREGPRTSVSVPFTISMNCCTCNKKKRCKIP